MYNAIDNMISDPSLRTKIAFNGYCFAKKFILEKTGHVTGRKISAMVDLIKITNHKSQDPNKEMPKYKSQDPRTQILESLAFIWSLVLGSWNLFIKAVRQWKEYLL
jgi:hypothetical protein